MYICYHCAPLCQKWFQVYLLLSCSVVSQIAPDIFVTIVLRCAKNWSWYICYYRAQWLYKVTDTRRMWNVWHWGEREITGKPLRWGLAQSAAYWFRWTQLYTHSYVCKFIHQAMFALASAELIQSQQYSLIFRGSRSARIKSGGRQPPLSVLIIALVWTLLQCCISLTNVCSILCVIVQRVEFNVFLK